MALLDLALPVTFFAALIGVLAVGYRSWHAAAAPLGPASQEKLAHTERLATVGTLSSGVAHEVGNPLAYVIGNTDLMAADISRALAHPQLPADLRASLKDVHAMLEESRAGLEKMRAIVASMRDLSHSSPGARRAVDAVATARSVLLVVGDRARKKGVRIEDALGDLPPVHATREDLGQVMLSLTLNAIDATPKGGFVRLSGAVEGRHVALRVEDSGPGISNALLPRLFTPFATTKEMGSGLGLATSRRLVESNGGSLTHEPRSGAGATFVVRLPAAEPLQEVLA